MRDVVVARFERRLARWKRNLLPKGRRIRLANLPIYFVLFDNSIKCSKEIRINPM